MKLKIAEKHKPRRQPRLSEVERELKLDKYKENYALRTGIIELNHKMNVVIELFHVDKLIKIHAERW